MSALQIATRGSKLALWQAHHVQGRLRALGQEAELLVLKTTGDRVLDRPLAEVGGKGLFTKEIEDALLDGRAQVAVHSMKDLPAQGPQGLCVAAVPVRADPRDALLLAPGFASLLAGAPEVSASALLGKLPSGARVGTSSLRRVCQLRRLRPDLTVVPLRGNVDTRLRKLHAGELDAAVLAAAGLMRLGLGEHIAACFTVHEMLPACGQGALAVQCRADDQSTRQRLAALADTATALATAAERAFSLRLGGSCQTPLGGHAHLRADVLHLEGLVGSVDGAQLIRGELTGPASDPEQLGVALAEKLLADGAAGLLGGLPSGRQD